MTEPSATDLAGIPSMNGLTAEEAQFVYLLEVLGMPVAKAAKMAGLPPTMVSKPHLQQARELLKREVRGTCQVTKEDVTNIYRDAIDMARTLADPLTMISGGTALAKLHGLDAPQKVDINVSASIDVLKVHVRQLPDAELARLAGSTDVIDADFYPVRADV